MQWNFYLSRQWSVFGEPGLTLRYTADIDAFEAQRPTYTPRVPA